MGILKAKGELIFEPTLRVKVGNLPATRMVIRWWLGSGGVLFGPGWNGC